MNDNPYVLSRQRRKANLSKEIRSLKPEDTRRHPCYVCGKWQSITHCHHVIEVSELAEWCLNYGFFYALLPVTFVWLCPNHHEWLHRLRDTRKTNEYSEALSADISSEEWEQYLNLEVIEQNMWGEMWARELLVRGIESLSEQHALILARMEKHKKSKEGA